MDVVLNHFLPRELGDIIAKEVHRLNFKGCLSQIKYCVVKIYSDGEYGFITSNNHNYYESLLDDELIAEVINNEYKNAKSDYNKVIKKGQEVDGSLQIRRRKKKNNSLRSSGYGRLHSDKGQGATEKI